MSSVEAVQERLICVLEIARAARLAGAVGVVTAGGGVEGELKFLQAEKTNEKRASSEKSKIL